jgi:hypothetical protein
VVRTTVINIGLNHADRQAEQREELFPTTAIMRLDAALKLIGFGIKIWGSATKRLKNTLATPTPVRTFKNRDEIIAANMTDKDQAVRRMTNTVSELKNALLPPNTKPATFAAPIYSPKTKVEPKRSVVTLVGLVAGGFFGLMVLVGVRVRN